jgi:hypothetical protein
MAYPISDVARRIIYSGSAGVGPYSFAFEVLEQTDVAVYKNTTLLTLTTDYTVTINVDGTGSITLVSPAVAADDITLIGARAIERTSDFVTGGDLFANTLNDELDSQTIFAQQQQDEINRSMKMAPWTNTAFNTQLPDPQPNKFLAFNATADGFQSASGSELANLVAYANAFADTFVGDGSTTSWTLTRTPASLLNLDVSIDGVTQVPTTNYTTSGTTFTMTSAPPSGSVILVRYAEVLADSNGDSVNVRYTPAGTGAVDTTVQAKLRETVSVKDFGAVGDGVTDDTAAIQAALDSGASSVSIPQGNYSITGLEIKSGSVLAELIGYGNPTLTLTTATNAIALKINKTNFVTVTGVWFVSTGTSSDGNNTIGIQVISKSFMNFNNLRVQRFSGKGMELAQVVYVNCSNLTIQSCTYGLDISPVAAIGPTTVCVDKAYITGCLRGVNTYGSTITFKNLVLEYCGSNVTVDGAFHCNSGGCLLLSPYWEANNRNIVATDSPLQLIDSFKLQPALSAPDVITYSALSFNLRGNSQFNNNFVKTRYLSGDDLSGYDLNIGENLIAPLTGSVNFGGQTMETVTGTVTTATWTTIKTLTNQSGDGAARKTYRYSVYAGRADLTTGYDSGTILNATLYSDSGSTPAWLQMSGNDLQINITNTSYGLDYGCTFTVIEGIGAP